MFFFKRTYDRLILFYYIFGGTTCAPDSVKIIFHVAHLFQFNFYLDMHSKENIYKKYRESFTDLDFVNDKFWIKNEPAKYLLLNIHYVTMYHANINGNIDARINIVIKIFDLLYDFS